ncbi:MAG: glycosyltransferase family A protein [Candidatus Uhrbacteria bacterium]|nr:glycosyltransferase family A protein [Candidatus Uhrbacteria bacterium]
MNNPLISVIIPVYNGERHISHALESVFAQQYPNLEVIVMNDGSTDNTAQILKTYTDRIRVITQANQGQSAARNTGIKHAKGTILGFLDADDLWTHHHIQSLLPHLLQNEPYDTARGFSQFFRSVENKRTEITKKFFALELLGSALFRTSVFDRVGLFDETMRQGEDLDWRMRFEEARCIEKRVDATTVLCRRHASNMTNANEVSVKGRIEAFRKKLQRERNRLHA